MEEKFCSECEGAREVQYADGLAVCRRCLGGGFEISHTRLSRAQARRSMELAVAAIERGISS